MDRRIKLRTITKVRFIAATVALAGVAFTQMARAAGPPRIQVTSFEGVNTGDLVVSRK